MRWLRNAAYLTAAAATSPIWSWRMHRTGKLRTDWPARFGRGEALPRTGRARILIYAVSVGEVNAIRAGIRDGERAVVGHILKLCRKGNPQYILPL